MNYKAVTLKATGQVLRAGYSNFAFDPGTETLHTITGNPVLPTERRFTKVVAGALVAMTPGDKELQLSPLQDEKQVELADAMDAYIAGAVGTAAHQRNLLLLYTAAAHGAKPIRRAHLHNAFDWVEVVLADYVTRLDAVEMAADISALDAVSTDFSNNDAAKPVPMPTVRSALAIPN